jgi:hypothetical protein
MRIRRRVAIAGAVGTLAVTGLLTGAPTASAASAPGGCWAFTVNSTDVFKCYNQAPVYTYKIMSFSSGQAGWLYSDPSWFSCWDDGGDNNAGGKWLYTVGDTGGAGFIPANEAGITSFPAAWRCDFG